MKSIVLEWLLDAHRYGTILQNLRAGSPPRVLRGQGTAAVRVPRLPETAQGRGGADRTGGRDLRLHGAVEHLGEEIQRLETLIHSKVPGIADLASLVLAVARVKPHKRRRFKFLARTIVTC